MIIFRISIHCCHIRRTFQKPVREKQNENIYFHFHFLYKLHKKVQFTQRGYNKRVNRRFLNSSKTEFLYDLWIKKCHHNHQSTSYALVCSGFTRRCRCLSEVNPHWDGKDMWCRLLTAGPAPWGRDNCSKKPKSRNSTQ